MLRTVTVIESLLAWERSSAGPREDPAGGRAENSGCPNGNHLFY